MKNAEVIANDLLTAIHEGDDVLLSCVADYISCPSEPTCQFDGKNNTPCCACKIEWLKKEWD